MIRMNKGRGKLSLVFLSFLFLTVISCNRVYSPELNLDVSEKNTPEVELAARFPSYEKVGSLFHAQLLDSGIVPVEVLIHNNGERRLTIHHPNELRLIGAFEGLSLEGGSTFYKPVRPVDAFAAFTGYSDGALKYKINNNRKIAAGAIFPPFGMYVAYKEIRYGRLYRALVRKSLFPVLDCGLVKPVELEAGSEVRGFVYFKMEKKDLPYKRLVAVHGAGEGKSGSSGGTVVGGKGVSAPGTSGGTVGAENESAQTPRQGTVLSRPAGKGDRGRGVGRRSKYAEKREKKARVRFHCAGDFRLNLRACFSVNGVDTLAFESALEAERSGFQGGSIDFIRIRSRNGIRFGRDETFFAISKSGSKSKRSKLLLYPGRFADLVGSDSEAKTLAGFYLSSAAGGASAVKLYAGSAKLADCSSFGDFTACAVNFKSSSKVFIWSRDNQFKLLASKRFAKRIKRVFLIAKDAVVLTENGFAYMFPLEDKLERSRYIKAGRNIDDAFVAGDILYVFERNGLVRRIALTGNDALKVTRRDTIAKGERRIVAFYRNNLIVMKINRKALSFSLNLFNTAKGSEKEGMRFPGEAAFYSFDGGVVSLQLKDGTFLRLIPQSKGNFLLDKALYVPFAVKAAHFHKGNLVVMGEGGLFASRAVGDFEPGSIDIIENLTKIRCMK